MTSKERILAALKMEDVDYVPCAPFMNFQHWVQRKGKLWQFPFGPSEYETADYLVNSLGLDYFIGFSFKNYRDEGVKEKVVERDGLIHKYIYTPSGTLHASVLPDGNWPHGFDIPIFDDYLPSHCKEFWIKTKEDVECFRHLINPPRTEAQLDHERYRFKEAKNLADQFNLPLLFSHGLGLTGAISMFGPANVCSLVLDEPELIDAYLEYDHQSNMEHYERAVELGVDIVRRNGFYETCDLFSPQILKNMLGNRIKEEAAYVKKHGIPFTYTILSGINPILDHLEEMDLDCMVCPDIFLGNTDGPLIAEKLKGKMSFWTGPSDTVHMPYDDTEAVRSAVREVFEVFGKKGLILTACSSAKAVFPWVSFMAMRDEWLKLR